MWKRDGCKDVRYKEGCKDVRYKEGCKYVRYKDGRLYASDAADDGLGVDPGGRGIIRKKDVLGATDIACVEWIV